MKNQIIFTFLLLGLFSIVLISKQNRELAGAENKVQYKDENINLKKINVFKWIINIDYRRNYVKRINEKF